MLPYGRSPVPVIYCTNNLKNKAVEFTGYFCCKTGRTAGLHATTMTQMLSKTLLHRYIDDWQFGTVVM